jgi:hypothetical protein
MGKDETMEETQARTGAGKSQRLVGRRTKATFRRGTEQTLGSRSTRGDG